jgi:ribosomal protein L11 methyltransferase
MPDRWLQVQLEVPRDAIAEAEALLETLGALVSWTESASDEEILEPAPGAAPLWAEVRITALFAADASRADLSAAIKAGLGPVAGAPGFSMVEDRDWDADWRRQLKPLRFGQRLWICPVGQPCPATDGISVILEPGLAFGTGTHPSKRRWPGNGCWTMAAARESWPLPRSPSARTVAQAWTSTRRPCWPAGTTR